MTDPLLSDLADHGMPGVLTVTAPRAPLVPLVFDSPHSGLSIPPDFRPAVSDEMIRISADTHVHDLFAAAPDLGAPLLQAEFPRSFIDVNRSLRDMDISMLGEDWPYPLRDSSTARRGMGLMWRYAWGHQPMHESPLTRAEAEGRIIRYWQPYHRHLAALLNTVHGRFGVVYHINCHSMAGEGHAISSDAPGTPRADICLGDLHGRACGPELVTLIADTLRTEGLSVALNAPFRGAELAEAYSCPARGRHSLQFEVNRRLYMNEQTRERAGGYMALKAVMTRLCGVLADFALANAGDAK